VGTLFKPFDQVEAEALQEEYMEWRRDRELQDIPRCDMIPASAASSEAAEIWDATRRTAIAAQKLLAACRRLSAAVEQLNHSLTEDPEEAAPAPAPVLARDIIQA
jgi:hypothetical protein